MSQPSKVCTKCGVTKPLDEFSLRGDRGPGARQSACKACARENSRRWYQANREQVLERTSAYQRENREQSREYVARWNAKNREQRRAYSEAYRAADPDRIRRQQAEFRQRHPDKPSRDQHRRRALLAAVPHDPQVTLSALRERDGGLCGYCGVLMDFATPNQYAPNRATLEHLLPVSKGGGHTFSNTALCCRACNVSKGNSLLIWQWVGRLRT